MTAHKKSLLFADYTREELRALAPSALVLLPLGATEQHGPHLPAGTDYMIVEHLAMEASTRAAEEIPVVVAPTLPFGCSEHHLPFGGTLSLRTEIYYGVLCGLLQSLARDGFERVFLLNGHGGNHELIQLAARDVALAHKIQIGAASYWTLAWDALIALGAQKAANVPGHAGKFETSIMMALRGAMVSSGRPYREHVADGDPKGPLGRWRFEKAGAWQAIDGYTDSPASASAVFGEQYLSVLIEAVHRSLIEFYRETT